MATPQKQAQFKVKVFDYTFYDMSREFDVTLEKALQKEIGNSEIVYIERQPKYIFCIIREWN